MNAVIYKRVSTDEQAEDGHHSLDAQERLCKEFAKKEGYNIVRVFEDAGKSATTMNRPALKDMISFIEGSREIEAVLVQDTDRMARNTSDHFTIKALLKKFNSKLISVSQPQIDDSAEGEMIDTFLAGMNTFQSRITARKTLKGLEQRAQKGWLPGEAPFGYKNANDGQGNNIIVIDEEKAPYIKMLFNLYVSGKYSGERIKDILTEKGMRSKRNNIMQLSKIHYMLRNPFYYGEFRWAGKIYQGSHKPLITRQIFDLTQVVLSSRIGTRNYERKHNFLLSGFLFCDLCGRKFTAEHHNKHKNYYGYYHCTRGKKCGNQAVPLMLMEKQVEKAFNKINFSDNFKEKLLAKLKIKYTSFKKDIEGEAGKLIITKGAVERKRDKMEQTFFEGVIDSETYQRNKGKINEELARINTELLKLKDQKNIQIGSFEEIIEFAQNPYQAYLGSSFEAKRLLLGFFWERFIIKNRTIVKSIPTEIFQALLAIEKSPVLKGDSSVNQIPGIKNFDKKFINPGFWGD